MRTIENDCFSSIRVEDSKEKGVLFSAYDVCQSAGITGIRDVRSWVNQMVDDKEKVMLPIGSQSFLFLTLTGVNSLLNVASLGLARKEAFMRWITCECTEKALPVVESARDDLSVYNYNGSDVTFVNKGGVKMINATQMAKAVGKEIKHWSENRSTTEFIVSLAEARGIKPAQQFVNLLNISDVGKAASLSINDLANLYPTLVKVVKGGLGEQGTWLQEDVAIEFARWLSPKFAIWCNDKIKELVNKGVVSMSEDEQILNVINLLQERIAESRKQLAAANETINQLQPAAEYTEKVLAASNTYTFMEMANELRLRNVNIFTALLKADRIVYKNKGGHYQTYANYTEKGYFTTRTSKKVINGKERVFKSLVVTETGREFLHQKYNKDLNFGLFKKY